MTNDQFHAKPIYYGHDCGGKKNWVSAGFDLGTPYSNEQFLNFDWYKGPGVLLTEVCSFYARPKKKTASLSQYFLFEELSAFLDGCRQRGVEVRIFPNKHTWKEVATFMDQVKNDPDFAADYAHIDFSSFKRDASGKFKYDELESMVLSFIAETKIEATSPLKSIRDPDMDWDLINKIKHAVIDNSNRRLNEQRIRNSYDNPDFARLRDLLPAIEEEVMNSNHPGADVLRKINAFPLPRAHRDSDKWGIKKGEIKLHEITPALKSVWSCRVDESGNLYGFGFQMLWNALGGSPYRYRSGVAGAQLRYDVHKEIRRSRLEEAGLPELKKTESGKMLTRDKRDPYYGVRIQSHKDLKNVVKFLNATFEKLL